MDFFLQEMNQKLLKVLFYLKYLKSIKINKVNFCCIKSNRAFKENSSVPNFRFLTLGGHFDRGK